MTDLLTRANPEQEARLRALVSGKGGPEKAPRRKRGKPRAPQLVSQYCAPVRGGGIMVQLPIHLDSSVYNANGAYRRKAATARRHVDATLLALRSMLRTYGAEQRAAIRCVTFVRIGPAELDDDNLPAAFKHVRDATFAWLVHGDADFGRRAIGHFDATVKKGKHKCLYEQQKCEANPRAHGIQIRFSG